MIAVRTKLSATVRRGSESLYGHLTKYIICHLPLLFAQDTGCLKFDYGPLDKTDDFLLEHGGLPRVRDFHGFLSLSK